MGRFHRFLAVSFLVAQASLPVASAADWSVLSPPRRAKSIQTANELQWILPSRRVR
jgi:hypothetical protein